MLEENLFTFVVYHTAISPSGIEVIGDIYDYNPAVKWKERWKKFERDFFPFAARYIEACFSSIRLVHQKCRLIVLTDEATPFDLPDYVQIVRYPLNPDTPAYMRLKAQLKYLEQADSFSHIIFLDYDMLVQRSLSKICSEVFDVALTCQSSSGRIEGSFMMVHKNSIEKGIEFLKMIEACFKKHFSDYEAWGGVEASMNKLIAVTLPFPLQGKLYAIGKVSVRVLSGYIYNYPFSSEDLIAGIEYLPSKVILHFRGDIKPEMLNYFRIYLSNR